MGSCCGTQHAGKIRVILQGVETTSLKSQSFQQIPYDQLKTAILSNWEQLKSVDYELTLEDGIPVTAQNYNELIRGKKMISMIIRILPNFKFDSKLDIIANTTVQIYNAGSKRIECTGLFVSDKHILTAFSETRRRLGSFVAILPNGRTLKLVKNQSEVMISDPGFIIFEVEEHDDEIIEPVKLHGMDPTEEDTEFDANTMYYTTGQYRMFGQTQVQMKDFDENWYLIEQEECLPQGADGAPFFKLDAKGNRFDFIGILRDGKSKNVIKSTAIFNTLVKKYSDFAPPAKEAIKYFLGQWEEITRKKVRKRSTVSPNVSIRRDYSSVACHISGNNLIEIGPKITQRLDQRIQEDFGAGFSIIGFESGVLITGGSVKGNQAFLWRQGELEKIGDMQQERENHWSIVFEGQPIVIGGLNERWEKLNTSQKTWESFPALQEPRSGASVVQYQNSLYLIGGLWVLTRDYYSCIEKYAAGSWQMIEFTLPIPLAYAGAMVLQTGQILVFAGRSDKDSNNAAFVLDIENQTASQEYTVPIQGAFSQYQAMTDGEETFQFCQNGQILAFNSRRKKFYELHIN